MTVKEIRKISGLTQKAFSEMYDIPRRTLEDWERGIKEPAPYLVSLLERAVKDDGIYKLYGHFTNGEEYFETFKDEDELHWCSRSIRENAAAQKPEKIIGKIDFRFVPKYIKDYIDGWVMFPPEYEQEKEEEK